MKSISFASLFVSTLVVSASAVPHFNNIFGRTSGDACYTNYGDGHCKTPKHCKGLSFGKKYCGGGYDNQCCVELVCKVPEGTGYCRSVQGGGCPGGSFHYGDPGSHEWPCKGEGIQCCVPGKTPYPDSPDSDTSNTNNSTDYPGGNAKIHRKAIEMIKEFEGFRGETYKDQVGVDTIGYGHNCETAPGTCEGLHQPISEKEAEDLMMKDLEQFEKCVCEMEGSDGLNSNEFGALVSYAFNVGCYGTIDDFSGSMKKKDYKAICGAIPTTRTIGDVLKNRRAKEGELCDTPTEQSCGCKGRG